MKIRTGFVSNSSSSSFILGEKDLFFIKGHKYYKISDLIDKIKPLQNIIKSMKELHENAEDEIPYFLWEQLGYLSTDICSIEQLEDIENETPGLYITEAIDRDYAYEQNWDFKLFEGDL